MKNTVKYAMAYRNKKINMNDQSVKALLQGDTSIICMQFHARMYFLCFIWPYIPDANGIPVYCNVLSLLKLENIIVFFYFYYYSYIITRSNKNPEFQNLHYILFLCE